MNIVPCVHLVERDPASCIIGRTFPIDCNGCAAYVPGLTEQERTRCETWQMTYSGDGNGRLIHSLLFT